MKNNFEWWKFWVWVGCLYIGALFGLALYMSHLGLIRPYSDLYGEFMVDVYKQQGLTAEEAVAASPQPPLLSIVTTLTVMLLICVAGPPLESRDRK